MAKAATIHARLDEQVKEEALAVFNKLGISLSEAITLYFRQVALKNGIPFDLTTAAVPRNNLERVHEFRREDLKKILGMLPDSIDELWVFGSSVTPYCRPDSDLDILVIGDHITHEELKTIYRTPDCAVDLLDATPSDFIAWRQDGGTIYHEAFTKGLLIYKKGVGLIE